MKKRIWSILLALTLGFSAPGATVWAVDGGEMTSAATTQMEDETGDENEPPTPTEPADENATNEIAVMADDEKKYIATAVDSKSG